MWPRLLDCVGDSSWSSSLPLINHHSIKCGSNETLATPPEDQFLRGDYKVYSVSLSLCHESHRVNILGEEVDKNTVLSHQGGHQSDKSWVPNVLCKSNLIQGDFLFLPPILLLLSLSTETSSKRNTRKTFPSLDIGLRNSNLKGMWLINMFKGLLRLTLYQSEMPQALNHIFLIFHTNV